MVLIGLMSVSFKKIRRPNLAALVYDFGNAPGRENVVLRSRPTGAGGDASRGKHGENLRRSDPIWHGAGDIPESRS